MLVTRSTPVPTAESAGRVISSELTSRGSDLGRLGLYRAALRAVIAKPVLGWGPGNFQLAWQHSVDAAGMAPNLDSWGSDAHSLPLEVMATAGILGFLSLLTVATLFTAALLPIVRRQELSDAIPLLAAIALAVPLCLNPQSVYLTPLLFLLAGLATPRSSVPDRAYVAEVSAAREGDARSVLDDWIRPGLTGLVGVALLASVFIGVVALQADTRLLRGLARNDARTVASAADHFPVYPLMYFMAGKALAAAPGTATDAIAAYEKGLRLRPGDAYGLQSLAGAYVIASQPQSAVSTARQALRAFPLSPMARLIEARALLALGQRDEALRLNREALSVTTPSARSYSLAAETFYMAGDTPTATAVLEEGLTRYPGDASLQFALDQLR
jgi:tetratricopeptide (TPR) repeat protein